MNLSPDQLFGVFILVVVLGLVIGFHTAVAGLFSFTDEDEEKRQ